MKILRNIKTDTTLTIQDESDKEITLEFADNVVIVERDNDPGFGDIITNEVKIYNLKVDEYELIDA